MIEGISLAVEKIAETALKVSETTLSADEVADFGAVKPIGFGSLVRRKYSTEITQNPFKEINFAGGSQIDSVNLFGVQDCMENPLSVLHCNEVSKECAEFLCDYDITPKAWMNASLGERKGMIKTVTQIMAKEFELPKDWIKNIEPVFVSDNTYMVASRCKINPLENGGVDVAGVPALDVSIDCLSENYLDTMGNLYREMYHIKQYSAIDSLNPQLTDDYTLRSLIEIMKASDKGVLSDVRYIDFPCEIEARAYELNFRNVLLDRMKELYPTDAFSMNSLEDTKEINLLRELTEEEKQYLRENTCLCDAAIDNMRVDDQGKYHLKCRNEELAGKNHEVTGVKYLEKTITVDGVEINVVVPEFDSVFDYNLPPEIWEAGDRELFKKCTEQLRDYLEAHPEMKSQFNEQQLEQIMNGEPYIKGYTWHHSEVPGQMQLVETKVHAATGHTGGNLIWCGGKR